MAGKGLYKKSRREQVYEGLLEAATAPDSYAGKRLAPVKALAERFGTSVRTVQLALAQLEQEGYIQRRHGAGTFIRRQRPALAGTDHVVVAMASKDEVWGELAGTLMQRLHAQGRVPVGIDTHHPEAAALLHRAARGEADTFVIRGPRQFPFELVRQPAFREKLIVAVEEWASRVRPPHLYQVLHDYAHGGELLAEHLHARGHRRVLIVAMAESLRRLAESDDLFCGAARGRAFLARWRALGGGEVSMLEARQDRRNLAGVGLEPEQLLAALTGTGAPTAVFGYRDAEAWAVQTLLHEHRPRLLERVEIVGYGDTLWSRAARPALTTVRYPVAGLADQVEQVLAAVWSGTGPPPAGRVLVRPELIVRGAGAEEEVTG